MKRPKEPQPLPRHDYGLALQTAVSWLGDRYLLAEPVTRRNPPPFFVESRSWHDSRRRKH
jgi:hypothetical protein